MHEVRDVVLGVEPVGQVSGDEVPPRQTRFDGQAPHAVPFQAVPGTQSLQEREEAAPKTVVLRVPGGHEEHEERAPPTLKEPQSHVTHALLTIPEPGAHDSSQSAEEVAPVPKVAVPAGHEAFRAVPPTQKDPAGQARQKEDAGSR
jgi:hypothetical protein